MLSFVLLIVGFTLLVWGADKFVAGASALARRLGVPALIVGLTVVAFGTSAPELAVSVTAALKGANEIAVGNVLGSNIFNLLVVAGLSAVLCPLVVDRDILRRDWPLSIAAAGLLTVMLLFGGGITRWEGLLLLVLFVWLMIVQVRPALRNRAVSAPSGAEELAEAMPPVMIGVNIVLGLICIVMGGQLSVNGATGIARMFGLSETLIGLTIVAIGTSLPELVTSLVAAKKGENDIAMGNVIGSNLFNILLILGASALISPITVLPTAVIDSAILTILSIAFLLPAMKGKMSRPVGAVMALCYVGFTAYLIMRSAM
ncbi:calcium/sodium antiporter [Butyricicoccus faecihominis]|uniref:calcium/sodium antiporter n=1 Tax=Butyricicoccus faecihominis TaxID=1712515 RepID=UPI00247AD803|nr:calcium/sodium antiporter [Butyricicoccus faecihominis]MCQ5129242.1 calcium/sodium antiporter [Butyricicoccus faecihominis]